MSAISTPPLAIVEENLPNARIRRRNERTTKIRGIRAGTWVYVGLGVVVLSAIFPYYWSFLIGSGTASTINDPNMSWFPGGNFISNALSVVGDPAVNFWVALWNSIFSSTVIAASVVVFSTLAGWAFAKLRFRGGKWLLAIVATTNASSHLPPGWCPSTSCSRTWVGRGRSARSSSRRSRVRSGCSG